MSIFLMADPLDIVFGFAGRIVWAIVGGIIIWARSNLYHYMIIKRKIVYFFTRKKFVLVWNDDSPEISEKIITKLKNKKPGKIAYKTIKTPDTILFYPALPKYVHAIILVVTDVTKLDENAKKRNLIEDKLLKYVSNGGLLIGTHDLIYRRCRNEKLQKAFGCTIKKFQPIPDGIHVSVVKKHRGHPLLRNIDDTFEFFDSEIITGDWDSNILKLIVTSEDNIIKGVNNIPMLCVNATTYDGLLIWINCGDKGDHVCDSIKIPQPEFIQVLSNALKYSKKIKEYSNR